VSYDTLSQFTPLPFFCLDSSSISLFFLSQGFPLTEQESAMHCGLPTNQRKETAMRSFTTSLCALVMGLVVASSVPAAEKVVTSSKFHVMSVDRGKVQTPTAPPTVTPSVNGWGQNSIRIGMDKEVKIKVLAKQRT
jgi:hypothetical protein